VQRAIDRLGGEYEPEHLEEGQPYPVRNVSVPVFGPGGSVDLLLSVYGLPDFSTLADVERYADALRRASDTVSQRVGA
jgi:DNA-binding IclR family transcriptional regulator